MREHCLAAWFFRPSVGMQAEGGFPTTSFNSINLFNPIYRCLEDFKNAFRRCKFSRL